MKTEWNILYTWSQHPYLLGQHCLAAGCKSRYQIQMHLQKPIGDITNITAMLFSLWMQTLCSLSCLSGLHKVQSYLYTICISCVRWVKEERLHYCNSHGHTMPLKEQLLVNADIPHSLHIAVCLLVVWEPTYGLREPFTKQLSQRLNILMLLWATNKPPVGWQSWGV